MQDLYDRSAPPKQPIIIDATTPVGRVEASPPSHQEFTQDQTAPAGGGTLQMIGITPMGAIAAIGSNCMLDAFTWGTVGFGLVFQILVASAVGYFVLQTQRHTGEPEGLSRSKSYLVFALTALPVPLSVFIVGPAGVAGLICKWRKR